MSKVRDGEVLNYQSRAEAHSLPPSKAAVASCAVFVGLVAWFIWGALRTLQAFYGANGGPSASFRWNLIVTTIGTAGALIGVGLASIGARSSQHSHRAAYAGMVANGLAALFYAYGLLDALLR